MICKLVKAKYSLSSHLKSVRKTFVSIFEAISLKSPHWAERLKKRTRGFFFRIS